MCERGLIGGMSVAVGRETGDVPGPIELLLGSVEFQVELGDDLSQRGCEGAFTGQGHGRVGRLRLQLHVLVGELLHGRWCAVLCLCSCLEPLDGVLVVAMGPSLGLFHQGVGEG